MPRKSASVGDESSTASEQDNHFVPISGSRVREETRPAQIWQNKRRFIFFYNNSPSTRSLFLFLLLSLFPVSPNPSSTNPYCHGTGQNGLSEPEVGDDDGGERGATGGSPTFAALWAWRYVRSILYLASPSGRSCIFLIWVSTLFSSPAWWMWTMCLPFV